MDNRSYDMRLYSGQYSGDLGDFQKCMELQGDETAFCLAMGSKFARSLVLPIIGLCVPVNCTSMDVLKYLETTDAGYIRRDFESSLEKHTVKVFCQDQYGQKSPSESIGITMLVILLFTVCICVIATIIDILGGISKKATRGQLLYGIYAKEPRGGSGRASLMRNSQQYREDFGVVPKTGDNVLFSAWVKNVNIPTRNTSRAGSSFESADYISSCSPMKKICTNDTDHITRTASNTSRRGNDTKLRNSQPFFKSRMRNDSYRYCAKVSTGDVEKSALYIPSNADHRSTASYPLVDNNTCGGDLSTCLIDNSVRSIQYNEKNDIPMKRNKKRTPSKKDESTSYSSSGDGTDAFASDYTNKCLENGTITMHDDYSPIIDPMKEVKSPTDFPKFPMDHSSYNEANLRPTQVYNTHSALYDQHIMSQRSKHLDPITARTETLRARIRLKKEEVIRYIPDAWSIYTRFTLCFSLLASLRRWLHFSYSPNSVLLFHSVRTLCWIWIVVVDVFDYTSLVPSFVISSVKEDDIIYMFRQRRVSDTFAIGTLLLISGFTCVHQLAEVDRQYDNDVVYQTRMKKMRILKRIVHFLGWFTVRLIKRWVRLVPLYVAVVFLTQSALLITRNGPFWPVFLHEKLLHWNCMTKSMYNFMFVNNLLPGPLSEQCFPWTYYLAVDFQLFFIAPFIHLIHNNFKQQYTIIGYILLGVLSVVSRFFEQASCEAEDKSRVHTNDTLVPSLSVVFRQPQSMLIPFVFGALLFYAHSNVIQRAEELKMFGDQAIVMLDHSSKHSTPTSHKIAYLLLRLLNLKKFRMICIWTGMIGIISCVAGTLGLYHLVGSGCEDSARVFFSLIIVPWCFSLFLFFLPMVFGYGGMIEKFLTQSFWIGLSKLILGAYLTHPIVLAISNATKVYPTEMTIMSMTYEICGTISVTLFVGFIFHLVIEEPCIYIARTSGDEN